MKKVLITGGGGFVGQHLIESLLNEYTVICVDSKKRNLTKKGKYKYLVGDILDNNFLLTVLSNNKPDIIIHLAALSQSWGSKAEDVFKVNLFGTLNLYESVVKLKKKNKYNPKILYISSAEVYGNASRPASISETSPLSPISYYSASKTAADRASYAYSQNDGLKIVILRPFPHIGPGQRKGFFVPDMASQIAEIEKNPKKKKLMVGNLESTRDYLDVKDVIGAYKLMIKANYKKGDVFNICSGKGIKMKKLLNILLSYSGEKIEIKKDPARLRPNDVPIYVGNNEKIRKFINWSPKIDIKQTLKETLDYWRKLR